MKNKIKKMLFFFIIFLIASMSTGAYGTTGSYANAQGSDEYILTVIEDEETALSAGIPQIQKTFFPCAVAAICGIVVIMLIVIYLMECNKYRSRIRSLAGEMEHMPRSGLTIRESRSFHLDKLVRTVRQLEEDRVEDLMKK